MALSNNDLRVQVDTPIWEWCKPNPNAVVTSALSGSCYCDNPEFNRLQARYIYYYLTVAGGFWRYDTWSDGYEQLSAPGNPPVTRTSMRFVGSMGYYGRVISATSTTITSGLTFGGGVEGYTIRIISGKGAGQLRYITSVADPVIADYGTATAGSTSSLTDTTKTWTTGYTGTTVNLNNWVGYTVRTILGTGLLQCRKILYNTSTVLTISDVTKNADEPWCSTPWTTGASGTVYQIESSVITVDTAWTTTPDSTSRYVIQSGGIYLLSGASSTPFFTLQYYDVLSDVWYTKPTHTLMMQAAPTDLSLETTSEDASTWVQSVAYGTHSTTTLQDSYKNWETNVWAGYYMFIYSGTGLNQITLISSNTATTLTFATLSTAPDNTSRYQIVGYSGGTATSSAAYNTLTDSGKSWTTDRWKNYAVRILAGTGCGQVRSILSNTGTTITTYQGWNIQPDNTSIYVIQNDPDNLYISWGGAAETLLYRTGNVDVASHGRVLESGVASVMAAHPSDVNHTIYEQPSTAISAIAYTYIPTNITVGTNPNGVASLGTKVYVANTNSDSVSIIDTANGNSVTSVAVSTSPSSIVIVGQKVYVASSGSTTVSVIDTANGNSVSSVTTQSAPYDITSLGTKLYTANIGGTVSVIDSANGNSVTTVTVNGSPSIIKAIGTKVYVLNSGTTVNIIDPDSGNSVTDVTVGSAPQDIVGIGTKLYVSNGGGTTVSVIDTANGNSVSSVTVGTSPAGLAVIGYKVYVANNVGTTVSVIDTTNSNSVTSITVGSGPSGMAVFGNRLLVGNYNVSTVSIVDTANSNAVTTVTTGPSSFRFAFIGNKAYMGNYSGTTVSMIDMVTAQATTVNSHSFQVGQYLSIRGATGLNAYYYNGLQQITAVPSVTTFTYAMSGTPISSASGIGTQTTSVVFDASKDHRQVVTSGTSGQSTLTFASKTPTDINGWWLTGNSVGSVTVGTNPSQMYIFGSKIYISHGSAIITVVDTANNYRTYTITTSSFVQDFSVIGTKIYAANNSFSRVTVIDTANNDAVSVILLSEFPSKTAVIGTKLYVGNNSGNLLFIIDTANSNAVTTIDMGFNPVALAVIGTKLYVGRYGTAITVIDTANGNSQSTINVGTNPIFFGVQGTTLYVSNILDGTVSIIDTANGNSITTVTVDAFPSEIVFIGTKVYVKSGASGESVSIIDTANGNSVTTITLGNYFTSLLAVGNKLFTCNYFTTYKVAIIDTANGNSIQMVTVGTAPQNLAAMGTTVFVANYSSANVSVIDTASGNIGNGARVVSGAGTTTLTLSTANTGAVSGLMVFNKWAPSVSLTYSSGGTVGLLTLTLYQALPSYCNGWYVTGTSVGIGATVTAGAGTTAITLSVAHTGTLFGNLTFSYPWGNTVMYANSSAHAVTTGSATGQMQQTTTNTGNSFTLIAAGTAALTSGTSHYVIAKQEMIGAANEGSLSSYYSGVATSGSTTTLVDANAFWVSPSGCSCDAQSTTINLSAACPANVTGWYASGGTAILTGAQVVSGAGTATITLSIATNSTSISIVTLTAWNTNQLVGKKVKFLTGATGGAQELAITAVTATTGTLTFATATAPISNTTSYSIIGMTNRSTGTELQFAGGMSDADKRGKYLFSPRGGAVAGMDRIDITTDKSCLLWSAPTIETFTTGSMYAYDGRDKLYFTKDATQRIYCMDLNTNWIHGATTYPYAAGTAVLGNRMEIFTTVDGLKYMWLNRPSFTECFKQLLYY